LIITVLVVKAIDKEIFIIAYDVKVFSDGVVKAIDKEIFIENSLLILLIRCDMSIIIYVKVFKSV
jgi:hypothetical protein